MNRRFLMMVYLALATLGTGCGTLTRVYVQPGYNLSGPAPIKHVRIAAWAPQEHAGLAQVMAHVASDLIKLRKNYLVMDAEPQMAAVGAACPEHVEGMIWVRVLDVTQPKTGQVYLRGALEMYRCSDGALIFRSEGASTHRSMDRALSDLTANYQAQLGEASLVWAAPAFNLYQALVEPLPDPTLSDADIEEKIELGFLQPSAVEGISSTAQLCQGRFGRGTSQGLP
jgi:probable lipoprotein (TIGR04455 family)